MSKTRAWSPTRECHTIPQRGEHLKWVLKNQWVLGSEERRGAGGQHGRQRCDSTVRSINWKAVMKKMKKKEVMKNKARAAGTGQIKKNVTCWAKEFAVYPETQVLPKGFRLRPAINRLTLWKEHSKKYLLDDDWKWTRLKIGRLVGRAASTGVRRLSISQSFHPHQPLAITHLLSLVIWSFQVT